jgi:hypothetical protein
MDEIFPTPFVLETEGPASSFFFRQRMRYVAITIRTRPDKLCE